MEDMQRLLRVQPSTVIAAARRGSFPAIKALSTNSIDVIPEAHQPEVLAFFCAHIRKTPIRPKTHPYDIVQCFFGLSILIERPNLRHLPDVMEAYPKMVKWFIYFVGEVSRGLPLGDKGAMSAYMHIIYVLVKDPELRPRILETADSTRIAIIMWLATDDETVLPVYPGVVKAFALLLHYSPETITNLLLSSTGANMDLIALHAVIPLRFALKTHPHPHDGFFHSYVWLIEEFSTPGPAAPFVPAMLEGGAASFITRTLLRFSRRDVAVEGPHEIVGACLRTLRHLVETGTGIAWVAQSVRTGLLAALVNIAPSLHTLDQYAHDAYMALIQDIIPRYLLFRPVIKAVALAFAELANGPNFSRPFPRLFADSWAALKKIAQERIADKQTFSMLRCANCTRKDSKYAFRRCSRCRMSHYCSVGCQEADWRNVHKVRCLQWSPPTGTAQFLTGASVALTNFSPARRRRQRPRAAVPAHLAPVE
ncbi:hypothetical protein FA95DRAFT_247373 [Auriscalpium vulgare]|uniref:Uncharacterized protein n=1 Tax=Auriscalpium vulgare TaxID=40419 RepID=A0ACB8RKW6_9AGAM|nr:hypothetical protein FA95DRAFT_247373 [Auriscalpium vulgare]